MDAFYFGPMSEYIEVGYAPTDRAKCKGCKTGIAKQSLRIGICMDDDHFNAKYWYHLDCFTLKPRFKEFNPEQQIYNIENLEGVDAEKVVDFLKEEVARLKQGRKATKKKPAPSSSPKQTSGKGKKSKKSELDQEETYKDDEESDEDFGKKSKRMRSKSIKSVKSVSSGRVTRSTARGKSKTVPEPSPSPVKAVKKKKKATKKVKPITSGYSEAQLKQYKEYCKTYMGYGTQKLKGILAANNQSRSGNKTELIEKCADGKVLGKISMCPSCGGGKLRFNYTIGIYKCPGYMDDDEFKNCNKLFGMEEIVRQPWVEP